MHRLIFILSFVAVLGGCSDSPWNSPYSDDQVGKVLYTSFAERPKHLDPARSYSSDEFEIIGQIYEPPLGYHYLKRPYQLQPLTLTRMPEVSYLDSDGNKVEEQSSAIAFTEYELELIPGISYQDHPALVNHDDGTPRYVPLSEEDVEDVYSVSDFEFKSSRELIADDYVYQIKRLANPQFHSPIQGLMAQYIVGLEQLSNELKQRTGELKKDDWIDLRDFDLSGVEVIDRYRFKIRINGVYPQFIYWLSMPFFAPMAYEVDRFYHQPVLNEKNISLDWYPVGTGAFQLSVNNPNKQMVLERNPNFRPMFYPSEGDPEDEESALLADAGKQLPFLDRIVFNLEKESIPYWSKFLQGYYDTSGISSDAFDQAISTDAGGEVNLTEEMQDKGISLKTSIATSVFYFGFNMLDERVGGYSEKARKLRRAIAMAVDYEEYISIFMNGRGIAAQGPIPPGIFGHLDGEKGINPYLYRWTDGKAVKRSLAEAKQILAEAGYPDGVDPQTGQSLILNLDTTGSGPDSKARLDWWRKQFNKLGIQLVVRNTDYNRFRDKMRKGTAQMYQWGWNADYPDPENFFFLLYGPNGKVETQGENASNYRNSKFDVLFDEMKNMENGPERQRIINQMLDILRQDSPWLWGIVPKGFSLQHAWYFNAKPNAMAHNTLMYKRIDPQLRLRKQYEWNQPVLWPLGILFIAFLFSLIPAWRTWKMSETRSQAHLHGRENL